MQTIYTYFSNPLVIYSILISILVMFIFGYIWSKIRQQETTSETTVGLLKKGHFGIGAISRLGKLKKEDANEEDAENSEDDDEDNILIRSDGSISTVISNFDGPKDSVKHKTLCCKMDVGLRKRKNVECYLEEKAHKISATTIVAKTGSKKQRGSDDDNKSNDSESESDDNSSKSRDTTCLKKTNSDSNKTKKKKSVRIREDCSRISHGEANRMPENLEDIKDNLGAIGGMDSCMMDSIPGKMKKSKFVALNKKIEAGMTEEQKLEEAEVRRRQLEQIFQLMKEQEEKLGIHSTDEIMEQMKLYSL